MPVRSLDSSVRKWPDPDTVLEETRQWASHLAESQPTVLAIGLFGSYGRGDPGVGSDLDIIILVREDERPFHRRFVGAPEELPLPADILVYTQEEWRDLHQRGGRFSETIRREARWLHGTDPYDEASH